MSSNALPPFLSLRPSPTFQPLEIDYVFFGSPLPTLPHEPQVAAAVELHQADVATAIPAETPSFQAPQRRL
uniref:Uncharacterized protein n=1 Tax=Physcomitrium patens TaxID=3218 RepID=A0A2K1KAD5_PHYPA|nr:hypothetical protein PHYPA_009919 [Physcomitrium patens]